MATGPQMNFWRLVDKIKGKFECVDHFCDQARILINRHLKPNVDKMYDVETTKTCSKAIDLDILDKKIRRLVCKLKKYNVDLEVFEHRDITYGHLLGKGGEGEVHQCTVIYNQVPIDAAVKTLLNNSDEAVSHTLDEVELLCLAWDSIYNSTLRVYGVAAVPEEDNEQMAHLVMVTEAGLMNALELYQREDILPHVTCQLWGRLAAAVHCMHTKHILHQDIKPENVLITAIERDKSWKIQNLDTRVIDLGMGKRVFTEKIVSDDILGTVGYHAPEVLMEESYDFRSDIFMLGITFCVLLRPRSTLKSGQLQKLLKEIHQAKLQKQTGHAIFDALVEPASLDILQPCTTDLTNMICEMLEEQTQRNISLLSIVQQCREAAECIKKTQGMLPPQISPCVREHDSGFSGSHNHSPQESLGGGSSRCLRMSTRNQTSAQRRTSRTSHSNTSTLTPPQASARCLRTNHGKGTPVGRGRVGRKKSVLTSPPMVEVTPLNQHKLCLLHKEGIRTRVFTRNLSTSVLNSAVPIKTKRVRIHSITESVFTDNIITDRLRPKQQTDQLNLRPRKRIRRT